MLAKIEAFLCVRDRKFKILDQLGSIKTEKLIFISTVVIMMIVMFFNNVISTIPFGSYAHIHKYGLISIFILLCKDGVSIRIFNLG
jgi:hypothetical protein